jgi:hypothetical protein
MLADAMEAKDLTGGKSNGSRWNEKSDEELISRIQNASEIYPSLRSLSWRMANRRNGDGMPMNERDVACFLTELMDASVAADHGHSRHNDWCDRKSKIEDLVESAFRKQQNGIGLTPEEIFIMTQGESIADLSACFYPKNVDLDQRTVTGAGLTQNTERRRLITMEEMMADLGPPDWLIEGHLESDGLCVLYGAPKTGKTFVALDMALSIASGQAFHGNAVQQGAVVYIAGEGLSGLKRRTQAWSIEHDLEAKSLPVFWSRRGQALTVPEEMLALSKDISFFSAEASEPIRLIVIDTLNRNFGAADENSTRDMTAFVTHLDYLRAEHDATILVVHHSGLSNDSRARGSSVLFGAVDASMQVIQTADFIKITVEVLKDADSPPPMLFSKQLVEFDIPDVGTASSLVLRTSDVPASVATKAEFFAENPGLASKTKRDRFEQRLPGILEAMHRGCRDWKSIAKTYGGNGKSTFDGYIKRVRSAGLVQADQYALTDKGMDAASRLSPEIGLADALAHEDTTSLITPDLPGQQTGQTGSNSGPVSG